MYKHYLKQTWNLIRQERLFSLIYMVGTGLSVSMVMVLSIVFYIKIANIYPETNRSRTLIAKEGTVINKAKNLQSFSSLSERVIQTCFGPLEGVEAIGLVYRARDSYWVQQDKVTQIPVSVKFVNTDFWTVFPFRFLAGYPFTIADQQSGLPTAVVARSLAQQLYGTTKVTGKNISLNFKQYRICGVVEDASLVSENTYGLLWIPYTASPEYRANGSSDPTGSLGYFSAYLLASPETDLKTLKAEAQENIHRYSLTLAGPEFSMLGQPDYHWQSIFRDGNKRPDYARLLVQYSLIFLILLLIPSVSLSGMTDSRMERRLAEMGVRRAFGAPVGSLLKQIICENFIFTLLGGLLGLIFSYLLLYLTRNWIMGLGTEAMVLPPEGTEVVFSFSMLVNYQMFGITLFVCFLLNLFSALIPAWRVSHRQIIYSLNAK